MIRSYLFTMLVGLLWMGISEPVYAAAPESGDGLSPAARSVLENARRHFAMLESLLALITDAESAERLAPVVLAAQDALLQLDFSACEDEDEELLAEESSALFERIDTQLTRLYDADFYGNATLKAQLGVAESGPVSTDGAPAPAVGNPELPAAEAITESVLP